MCVCACVYVRAASARARARTLFCAPVHTTWSEFVTLIRIHQHNTHYIPYTYAPVYAINTIYVYIFIHIYI